MTHLFFGGFTQRGLFKSSLVKQELTPGSKVYTRTICNATVGVLVHARGCVGVCYARTD